MPTWHYKVCVLFVLDSVGTSDKRTFSSFLKYFDIDNYFVKIVRFVYY